MSLPGFAADAALVRSRGAYRTAAAAACIRSLVLPQHLRCTCRDRCPEVALPPGPIARPVRVGPGVLAEGGLME